MVLIVRSARSAGLAGRRERALAEVAKLARMRFEGGQSTYLDVLDADRDVFQAQSDLAQSRRDEFVALVSIYKAMGGGWMVEQDKLRAAQYAAAAASQPAGQIK